MNILIELRCSYKIIPISIEKLGELIGNEKKTFPYLFVNKKTLNYIGNVPNREYFDSESDFLSFKNIKIFDMKKITIEYCLKDVEILEQVLNNIVSIISEYGKYLRNSYTFSSL